jgi:hypothetical protein
VSLAFHDHTYLVDFTIEHLPLKKGLMSNKKDPISDFVISATQKYEQENHIKFIGAAMPKRLVEMTPRLCPRLWLEMDVVPIVISYSSEKARFWYARNVDEQADSMARKCGEYYSRLIISCSGLVRSSSHTLKLGLLLEPTESSEL